MRSLASVALVLAVAGCADVPTAAAPRLRPAGELVDHGERLLPEQVNAHVYGSFRIAVGASGVEVITAGPANFPGHPPAGPGTCDDGTWINAQGRRTAGSLSKPHPHCIAPAAAVEVVLEPISACYSDFPTTFCAFKPLTGYRFGGITFSLIDAWVTGRTPPIGFGQPTTEGGGVIYGYAIDASTLGTTNRRVGIIRIQLDQVTSLTTNLFDFDGANGCALDATILSPCLATVITADYDPLPAPNGIGTPGTPVQGFLWFTPASAPYNYSDM